MNKSYFRAMRWPALVIIPTIAFLFLDLKSTVGIRSSIIGILPIEDMKKAEIIENMCARVVESPLSTMNCVRANASKDAMYYIDNIDPVCRDIKNVISGIVDPSAFKIDVISNEPDKSTLMSEGKFIFIDKNEDTILTMTGIIHCRDL